MPNNQPRYQVPPLFDEAVNPMPESQPLKYEQFVCICTSLCAVFAVMNGVFALIND